MTPAQTPLPFTATPETIPSLLPTSTTGIETAPAFLIGFPFALPIALPGRDTIDGSYRFGATQGGTREPHRGVEFLNSFGTPVLAAAPGSVLFAGNDFNGSPYTPPGYFAFYGYFVILEHPLPGLAEPVYSLYAHLSEVLAVAGDEVAAGTPLGLIGFSGAAVGSHLHFEVRYGGLTYAEASNPELWLKPHPANGSLAGSIRDAQGRELPVFSLEISRVDGTGPIYYLTTYEEPALAYRSPYFENFALGDLPSGMYQIAFVADQIERRLVEVRAGELSFLDILIGDG